MDDKILTIEAKKVLISKKKVCAYARVSTFKDSMLHSLSQQVSYYSNLIQSHNDWLYVGVYADCALTGTKDDRKEFQRMLNDARNNKIDIILVKSISRFARNTIILLEVVRELRQLGIDVYFEEQNIHTISSEGELMLSLLASFAQEESRSISENMKWRIKKEFEEGNLWGARAMLGYKVVDKKYVIEKKESMLVRRIFKMYLDNNLGMQAIANKLNDERIKTIQNNKWRMSSIRRILTNISYTGSLLLQKTYVDNHINKLKKVNKGEKTSYLVEDDHEAIIDKDTFDKVQIKIKENENENKNAYKLRYTFSSKIKCGICGASYRHKKVKDKIVWVCRTYDQEGKSMCKSRQIPEDIIKEIVVNALGLDSFNEDKFNEEVDFIVALMNNELEIHKTDGTIVNAKWNNLSRKYSWKDKNKEEARKRALMINHKRGDGGKWQKLQ